METTNIKCKTYKIVGIVGNNPNSFNIAILIVFVRIVFHKRIFVAENVYTIKSSGGLKILRFFSYFILFFSDGRVPNEIKNEIRSNFEFQFDTGCPYLIYHPKFLAFHVFFFFITYTHRFKGRDRKQFLKSNTKERGHVYKGPNYLGLALKSESARACSSTGRSVCESAGRSKLTAEDAVVAYRCAAVSQSPGPRIDGTYTRLADRSRIRFHLTDPPLVRGHFVRPLRTLHGTYRVFFVSKYVFEYYYIHLKYNNY